MLKTLGHSENFEAVTSFVIFLSYVWVSPSSISIWDMGTSFSPTVFYGWPSFHFEFDFSFAACDTTVMLLSSDVLGLHMHAAKTESAFKAGPWNLENDQFML